MESNPKQPEPFTDEERRNIIEYGRVLRVIHDRLVLEEYFLPNGKTWNIFKCTKPTGEDGKKRRKLV
jgi:hypothetical protein